MKCASWAEIDLSAIRYNLQQIKKLTQKRVIAVVKANAYGHGMVEVSRAIADLVDMFAVATLDEAFTLARELPGHGILNLFPVPAEVMDTIVRCGIHQTVNSSANLRALAEIAGNHGKPAHVHIKVDTGMHRIGIPYDQAVSLVEEASVLPGIHVEGISTHLACADELDSDYTPLQLHRFRTVLKQLARAGMVPRWIHVSNSAGVLHWSDSYFNAVRPGLLIYGLRPVPSVSLPFEPRPALTWKVRISQVRQVDTGEPIGYGCTHRVSEPTTVATIPVGYADGYRRHLSHKGRVLIHGRTAPILGRVCMDQTMCDVSVIEDVAVGDEVVLLGRQGESCIPAEEHATLTGTIHYDILTGIGPRVKRISMSS